MHHFDSQLISTVKPVQAEDGRVVFVGHYLHGDGASLPGLAAVVAVLILFAAGVSIWSVSLAALLLAGALALGVYRKRITFGDQDGGVEVSTRTLFSKSATTYPATNAKLRAQRIHIRLAENCGAIDLLLPDQTLRLAVDGRFDRCVANAKRLSEMSGVPMVAKE